MLQRRSPLGPLRQRPAVWALGVGGLFGFHFFFFLALRLAPPVEANLVNYSWPLLIVLFSALLPGERLRWWHVAGALLGLAGAVLLVAGGGRPALRAEHAAGYAAAVASAVTWAGYSVLSRRVGDVPTDAVGGFCGATAVLALACHLAFERTVWPEPAGWLAVLAMGLGPVGLAFFVWDYGVKRGDIRALGAFAYAAPLLSTLLLIGFGRGSFTWTVGAACGLIVGGAVLAGHDLFRARPAAQSTAETTENTESPFNRALIPRKLEKSFGDNVNPQARLLEIIGASAPGHSEAMQVMVLCLEQLSGNAGLSELASEITGWCRRSLAGKRVEIVELARDFVVILSKEHDYAFLGIVNDTKVRLLRLIHRLMPEMFGTMNQSQLIQLFELPRDRRPVVQVIREQAARASSDLAARGASRFLSYEQIAQVEDTHQRLGAHRFADLFIRNQKIALIAHDRPPQPVMTEIFVSVEALGKHLLAGVDLRKDENLFNRLTLTLDRLVLRTIRQLQIPLHNSSLNLNVETVFTGEFENLDNALRHNLQNLTIEFRAPDIVLNYDQFVVARELIISRGGTVAVDAIVPPMVGVLAASELGARLAKVFWRPGAAGDLRDRQAEIQKWHKCGTMVVLARLDDEEAVDVGRQIGIGLFQGFHVDKLLRANPVREAFRVA